VNTEITDTLNTNARTWVCYDAECALCVRWANRFRAWLEKHGFTLLPLQSANVRAVLQVPDTELLAEMRVITASGRIFGGADALAHISRIACKPLFWLTRIPGAMRLLRAAYLRHARHRNCSTGTCQKGAPK
jgi:predicted DCC family thiol-disulfide oxidoreductase YuxK